MNKILGIGIVLLLIAGLAGGIYLIQRETQLRSRASDPPCSSNVSWDGRSFHDQGEVVDNFTAAHGDNAESVWIQENNNNLISQGVPQASDGQTLLGQPCSVMQSYFGAYSSGAPARWVQEHNAAIGSSSGGSSSGGGSTGSSGSSSTGCGKTCTYSQDGACYSGNCLDGSQNCSTNDNCGYVPGCSSGAQVTCPASGGTGRTGTGSCRDNPETPPSGYRWDANCNSSGACTTNSQCPKGANNADGWCYGFDDGFRCMKLVTATTQQPATPAQPAAPAAPTTPQTPVAAEGGTCSFVPGDKIFDTNSQKVNFIEAGKNYIFEITFKNTGTSIWGKNTHKLKVSPETKSIWGLNKDTFSLTDSESVNKTDIAVNGEAIFRMPVKAPTITTTVLAESGPSYRFVMVDGSGSEVGAACDGKISVTVPGTGISTGPIEYKLAEGENTSDAEFKVRAATNWTTYQPVSTGGPMRVSFSLTNLKQGEIRYVSVMFRSGVTEKGPFTSKLLKYKGAGPKIAESPGPKCIFSPTGDGTEITITGTGFGAIQGKGTLKVSNKVAENIVSWQDSQVVAKVKELLTGRIPLIVTSDDGSVSDEKRCEVNTTSVDFTALLQCKSNNFSATNVDVRIYENVATSNPKTPFYKKTISLDKEGRPQGDFSPKFEAGKNYCVVVKPPNALAKQFCFTAAQNTTTSLDEPIRMLAGDVTGQGGLPDGVVGAPDFNKLKNEYGCKAGVKRLTDFNDDGCTNAFDFSCIRESIRLNEKDDVFDPAKAPAAGSPPATTLLPATLTLGTQTDKGDGTRDVVLSWTPVTGAIKYNIYQKIGNNQSYESAALAGVGGLTTTVNVQRNTAYTFKVAACATADNCVDSNIVSLPALQ